MGVDNRKRRAAKQRKQARDRGGVGVGDSVRASGEETWDAARAFDLVEARVHVAVRLLGAKKLTEAELARATDRLLVSVRPHPRHVVAIVLHYSLGVAVAAAVEGGWSPADLSELVGRNLGPAHLPTLAAEVGEDEPTLDLDADASLASMLGVVALLAGAPLLTDAIASTAGAAGPEHPKLARVRALLAKAESTEFDEEAEALSAKAQELISRYALDRLVADGSARGSSDLAVRRLWLDAPYVRAKTILVSAVASANRCRSASADRLGFSVVVGAASDLDAVELLVTSLLVQADAAMLRHGRRVTASGTTRTKSFRQSFLTAYATRVGERLAEADLAAARAAGADLLPVLRSQEAKVAEEFDRLVPHTVGRRASVSNGEGWAAGLAAADLAALDVNRRLNRTG